jgi:CBS domain-containing protein
MTGHIPPADAAVARDVVAVRKDAQFKDIVRVMRARRFSALPVLDDDDKVIGVVSEDDLLVREGYRAADGGPRLLFRHADRAKAGGLTAAGLRRPHQNRDHQAGHRV